VDAPEPSDGKTDRQAYLEEQIQRQKRGEPIDVEWVKAELERIRLQQAATIAKTQRNLRWLVVGASVLLMVLWLRGGGPAQGRILIPGLVLVGLLLVWVLRRRQG